MRFSIALLAGGLSALILAQPCLAQDIEPRRWSHLPLGGNFGGLAYAYTEGDNFFNPVPRIEDGEFEPNSAAIRCIRASQLLENPARVDLAQIYRSVSWDGPVNGVPAAVDRKGWADTALRFAVNLHGAPPLEREEFRIQDLLHRHPDPGRDRLRQRHLHHRLPAPGVKPRCILQQVAMVLVRGIR